MSDSIQGPSREARRAYLEGYRIGTRNAFSRARNEVYARFGADYRHGPIAIEALAHAEKNANTLIESLLKEEEGR